MFCAQTKYFVNYITSGSLVCVDINKESILKAQSSITNNNVSFISAEIDKTEKYIDKSYDLIFSAYGFYYSENPNLLHEKLRLNLNDKGRFVIVGPVLGNNAQLYNIVRQIGCNIPDAVIESSEYFMLQLFEIFLKNYKDVKMIRTINHITYESCEKLLEYWKNTTFYAPNKDDDFLNESKNNFPDDIIIDKSIAYLEGYL
jgi:ubiquinone/menaquinone biosynthesis C-methylase UbiE